MDNSRVYRPNSTSLVEICIRVLQRHTKQSMVRLQLPICHLVLGIFTETHVSRLQQCCRRDRTFLRLTLAPNFLWHMKGHLMHILSHEYFYQSGTHIEMRKTIISEG